MRHFRCLLLTLLLSAGGLSSPVALAAYCSNVFPGDETPTGSTIGAVLDLSIMSTATYTGFPSNGEAYTTAGDHFYRDINKGNGPAYASVLSTKKVISVTPGQPVRIFVDGDLDLGSDSEINSNGYAGDLILIVRGNLSVGTKNLINALIYVTGNIISNPDTKIKGALTAQGTIDTGKQGVAVTYDPNAAQDFAFGDVCDPTTPSVVHHYLLSYAPQALTCQPHAITVTACGNADCSSTVETTASLVASDSGGTGVASVAFATGTSGTTVAALPVRTPGAMTLSVAGATSQCSVTDCALSVADAGFILDVPPLLAGKEESGSIQAVRKDDATQLCMSAFESGTRTLLFTSTYSNPNSGTRQLRVNGQPVTTATPIEVTFGAQARAPLQVRYDDAGQMTLAALYAPTSGPESGLVMSGSTTYVSRPYGLCLQTAAEQGNDYGAYSSLFPGDVRAGDNFALTIKPVIWTEASAAALAARQALAPDAHLQAGDICGNAVTPNYLQSGIILSPTELNGGDAGALGLVNHDHRDPNDHAAPPGGGTMTVDQSISEVGVFLLTATPPDYLGTNMSHAVSESGRVGRLIPAYFKVEGSASLKPSCGSAFSYQGQPMAFANGLQPSLTITAYSSLNNVTLNYDRPDFWKLAEPAVGGYVSVSAELLDPADADYANKLAVVEERDARLVSQGVATLEVVGADNGDGKRTYTWSGQELLYSQPTVPGVADYPFWARIRQEFSAASLTDTADGVAVCHGDRDDCQPFSYVFTDSPGSEVRLGRLRIGNAHGSELQDLNLPLRLESWQNAAGGSFQVETMDTCTALGAANLENFTGNMALGETTPATSEPLAGVGSLLLSAPGAGNDGSVRVGFPALPIWLQYPWDGSVRQGAHGLATFGIYRGSAPLIFRREVYR